MTSVLITGANRGLGFGMIQQLLQHENPPKTIIATYRNPNKAAELLQLAEMNKAVHPLLLDVMDFSSYENFAKQVEAIVGDNGLNVLINNAGITSWKNWDTVEENVFLDILKTNTMAPTLLTRALLPLIKRAASKNADKPIGIHRAAIINVSSLLGSIELNDGRFCAYRASKAGLNMVTSTLALTLKEFGIIVIPLHPGWVQTDLGTSAAPLTVDTSVSGMTKVLYNLNESDNGKFLQWDGKELPW